MVGEEILNILKEKFGKVIVNWKVKGVYNPYARIKPENIREVAFFLRENSHLQFDYLMCLSGVDLGKGMLGVVYHLNSISKKHRFTLKVDVTRENPNVPSVEMVWKTANWHEREVYDLFGINFLDHPDLRRILLPDDWDGYPLRKDYQVQEYYNGIKVPY